MPRVIVTTDLSQLRDDARVLLDECVHSVHLSSDMAIAQLVERIAWAVSDAEYAESAGGTVSQQRAAARRSR
jgi:hypothetical protein